MTENKSNTYKNDRAKESGRTNPIRTEQGKDQNVKSKRQKIADVDSARHQIGRDNTSVQQKWQNVETAKEETIMKRCADR